MIRRYVQGERPDEIADSLEVDLETVAKHRRRAGVLRAFDDLRALAHLYHEYDHTLETLSETFDHARGPESSATDRKWCLSSKTPSRGM